MKEWLFTLFVSFIAIVCFGHPMINSAADDRDHSEEGHHPGHHKAYHGGVLNVIGKCETGHIEVRLEGDTLEAWLVGGGHDTDRSVPIKAHEIRLTVTIPGQEKRVLVLKADPIKLAGERIGQCSRFSARADWLKGVKKFVGQGRLVFKGVCHELLIKYHQGFDPGHGN